jgi:hypothetical protein
LETEGHASKIITRSFQTLPVANNMSEFEIKPATRKGVKPVVS